MLTLSIVTSDTPPDAGAGEAHLWRDGEGYVCARTWSDAGLRWIDWPGIGVFSFRADSQRVRVWPSAGMAPRALTDFFEHRLQPLILQAKGYQTLHASAVLGPGGVVGFWGASGSGKSTLAFALGMEGHRQCADDALVIHCAARHPEARLLPFVPQLRGPARDWLPGSAPSPRASSGRAPLQLLALLRQDASVHESPQVRRVQGPEACLALLTHAHCFNPGDDAGRLVSEYAALAQAVPVFTLTYRPHLPGLPALVTAARALMAEAPSLMGADASAP